MKITIEAEPKEVAALVLKIQERQSEDTPVFIDGTKMATFLQQVLKEACKRDH